MKIKKKNILILGASSGIGIETVKKFILNGWNVTAHYNSNNKKLKLLQKKYKFDLFKFNFSKIGNLEKYLKRKNNFFKKFDSLVSLTGFLKLKEFKNFNISDFNLHLNINYFSNILISREILKGMKSRGWGRILFASSIGTKFGGAPNTFIYSISKYLNEFFPSFLKEFYKKNVFVNTLQIGLTKTKLNKIDKKKNMKKRISLIPIKRIAIPSEVANYIYFLASENNTLITRQVINISGGE